MIRGMVLGFVMCICLALPVCASDKVSSGDTGLLNESGAEAQSNTVELWDFLGMPIGNSYEAFPEFQSRIDHKRAWEEYYNDDISFFAYMSDENPGENAVHTIWISEDAAGFSFCGLYPGMPGETAFALLDEHKWVLEEDYGYDSQPKHQYNYKDESGRYSLGFAVDTDTSKVLDIKAYVEEEIDPWRE